MSFLSVFFAEMRKVRLQELHSPFSWFSLFIWPVFGFLEVYYTYQPFLSEETYPGLSGGNRELLAFLATGFLAYTCFWSMVQNAWSTAYRERSGGTLTVTFLSPAGRLAMNYGRTVGALLEQIWMFTCFCLLLLIASGTVPLQRLPLLIPAFLLLLLSSAVWGGMLNAFFLFSRDASIIMDVLEPPMNLFAGARIPLTCFPAWIQIISLLFPLTYSLDILRLVLGTCGSTGNLRQDLICLGVVLLLMIGFTATLLRLAERKNRQTGGWDLF